MTNYVLDACALIAYINKEEGRDVIKGVFKQAYCDRDTIVCINKVNLLEVYYDAIRRFDEEEANEVMRTIEQMAITVIDNLSDEVFKKAGVLKIKHKISLADAVAVAESIVRDGVLVTSDHHELEAVERGEGVKILWFR